MNRLWALQILYWRASGPSLFIGLFRDNLMMPVLGLCSVQTLDSSTSCGSEPMAYDKLVILHYGHIGSLCVSPLWRWSRASQKSVHSSLVQVPVRRPMLRVRECQEVQRSIPIYRSRQSNPQRGNRWSIPKPVLGPTPMAQRHLEEASFWHVKQVDPAWDDLGSRARIGILLSSGSCTIGVAIDSGGCTDWPFKQPGFAH